jgi:hypothetical protein
MKRVNRLSVAVLLFAGGGELALADPAVGQTIVLGPFTGVGASLHPANQAPFPIRYYGTDLGWSYEHRGELHFLFGDTAATEKGEVIEASSKSVYDDGFGTIDLEEWPDPARITPRNIPLIRLGQNPGTTEMSAINPGHAFESFKTPLGGFSNGRDEFALFYASKPQACRVDGECSHGFVCDAGLGYVGERPDTDKGLTLACIDGTPQCNAGTLFDAAGNPVSDSGFCADRSSGAWADTEVGRISGIALKNLVSIRSTSDPRRYTTIREWMTSKFANVTPRTVADFVPARGSGRDRQDYRIAAGSGRNQRVFLWGRPGFVGVARRGRPLGLYFAYADMPAGSDARFELNYYTGTNGEGIPQFSRNERDAAPVDLDSRRDGIQTDELHDVVDQMSVSWVEPLGRWLMLYGGGMINLPTPIAPQCGVLEFFARSECKDVVIGNGAVRMRTAGDPWGPWSPPQEVLIGGDPAKSPPEGQYAPGGVLHHPDCVGSTCAPHTAWDGVNPREYGFLYGVNIIEQWTTPAGKGVDIIWNASTWDPYRVVLLRTHIER